MEQQELFLLGQFSLKTKKITLDFLQEEGLEIIETEDVEPYEEYQKKYNAPKEICGLVENLSEDKPIAVNRFDSYENE